MFSKKDINKSYILTYLNYTNKAVGSDVILTLEDFDVVDGRMHNDEYTVNIQPITGKFTPSTLTQTYYNDVVVYIASIERNSKINKIIK